MNYPLAGDVVVFWSGGSAAAGVLVESQFLLHLVVVQVGHERLNIGKLSAAFYALELLRLFKGCIDRDGPR